MALDDVHAATQRAYRCTTRGAEQGRAAKRRRRRVCHVTRRGAGRDSSVVGHLPMRVVSTCPICDLDVLGLTRVWSLVCGLVRVHMGD